MYVIPSVQERYSNDAVGRGVCRWARPAGTMGGHDISEMGRGRPYFVLWRAVEDNSTLGFGYAVRGKYEE